jgi:C4-dicarboxylate-specific signal transduction histidine kinase
MESTQFDKSVFFGKVTASVAHDLQNVLAVVKETSGLMQDILQINQNALPPEIAEKLTKSISSVQKQISRGVRITSGLNGFAHTADSPKENIDIIGVLNRTIFLTQRIFLHQGINIEIEDCDILPTILTDPLIFQMLIFNSIQYLGGLAAKQSILNILVKNKTDINININRSTNNTTDSSEQQEMWQSLLQTCEKMNAEINFSKSPVVLSLEFSS